MKPYLCSTWKTSRTWLTCCLKAQHLSTKNIRFSHLGLFQLLNVFIRLSRNIVLKKSFFIYMNTLTDKLHLQLPCRQQSVKLTLFNVVTGSRVKQQYLKTTRHQDDVCLGPCTLRLFDFRKQKTPSFASKFETENGEGLINWLWVLCWWMEIGNYEQRFCAFFSFQILP